MSVVNGNANGIGDDGNITKFVICAIVSVAVAYMIIKINDKPVVQTTLQKNGDKSPGELGNEKSPEKSRGEEANYSPGDDKKRNHIGASGGAKRRKSKDVHDPDSSEIQNNDEEYRNRVRSVVKHLIYRLMRYFKFGGMLQRISKENDIDRNDVVASGSSKYQDRSSNRGSDIHAAHVVRLGVINPNIKNADFNEIKAYLGHTQNVPKFVNLWHLIGGDIDRFQSDNLKKLNSIDFAGAFTADINAIIAAIKMDFIAILEKAISGGKYSDAEKSELMEAKRVITNITNESLFEMGKEGYEGKGLDPYRSKG